MLPSLGQEARTAAPILATAAAEVRNGALYALARILRSRASIVLDANKQDIASASHYGTAFRDRLTLDASRLESMAQGVERIAALPDPLGRILAEWTVPNGLRITRRSVPLGVIGIIYESRPNVTVDAAALCLKAGNPCLLRPGSESFSTARALVACITDALAETGLPQACVQMVPSTDRDLVGEMLRMPEYLDVLIPRGGKSLVGRVMSESRVPVLAHLEGNCHTYVDGAADLAQAQAIVLNAKMRRTGICGATETLLVDRACAPTHLPVLVKALLDFGCAVRGDALTCAVDPRVTSAIEEDWSTEYLDAILAVKVVDGVHDAIAHIARYGSHHTDCIVTENTTHAELFLNTVDSAIVMHNTSTQFADGGEFGMGAEIGIATGRLHARGPVGVDQLTTFKYCVRGHGQTRT